MLSLIYQMKNMTKTRAIYEIMKLVSNQQHVVSIVDTWMEWKTNFSEETTEKKAASAERLKKHMAACESAAIEPSRVASILFKVK